MSSTTKTAAITEPIITSSSFLGSSNDVNTLPTSGSTFGAMSYNINSMLGWSLGAPTTADVYLYSDLVNSGVNYYDVADASTVVFTANDANYADQTLVKIVSTFMTYGDETLFVTSFTPTDYSTQFSSSDGLIGMSWLPWNVHGVLSADGSGNYCVKTYYGTLDYVTCNPLRKSALYIKLFTTLKLLGISIGIFALGKLIYHFASK